MARHPFLLAALVAASIVLGTATTSAGDRSKTADREWSQARGNASRSSWVDVEPVRAVPQIAWRLKPDEFMLSEPVCWGGIVYFVHGSARSRKLFAVRAQTGEVIASKSLRKGGPVDLAVWEGTVVLKDEKQLCSFPHAGKVFRTGWKRKGVWTSLPLVARGRVICSLEGEVHVLDVKRGKTLASAHGPGGLLALASREGRPDVLGGTVWSQEMQLDDPLVQLRCLKIHNLKGNKVTIGQAIDMDGGVIEIPQSATDEQIDDLATVYAAGNPGMWLVISRFPFMGVSEGQPGIVINAGTGKCSGLCAIGTIPAAYKGNLYGFSKSEGLMALAADGSYLPMVEPGQYPRGAVPGPASIARNVVIFRNWAVDIETGRVLWCLPDLDVKGQAIPAADGLLIVVTKEGEILGLSSAPRPAPERPGEEAPAAAPSLDPPGDDDGVFLADGTFLRGKVEERPDGRIRVTPGSGNSRDFVKEELAFAQQDGTVLGLSDEYAPYRIWRDALDATFLESLEKMFTAYARAGLLEEARKLLIEGGKHGISPRDLERLQQRLTGRAQRRVEQIWKNLKKREKEWRSSEWSRFIKGVDWCARRKLVYAASALLHDAARIQAGRSETLERAKKLMPASFPWRHKEGGSTLWLDWSHRILRAGAVFLDPDDAAWSRLKTSPWNKETIGLRTRNLLVFSRTHDAAAVSGCLRNGEGSVRVLATLLGAGAGAGVRSDRDRLEVRIHRNKDEYEQEEGGNPEFTLGNYSPSEKISRFYVPEAGSSEVLGRALFEVLSHELTHQYVEERWVTDRKRLHSLAPGYWLVEGLARFVEDQALEMGRRGIRFDDDTVSSLDAAAQAEKLGILFDMKKFLQLSGKDFWELDGEPKHPITLRNTLRSYELSEVHLFYEQAGSLMFYLINRAGPERRKAVMKFVLDFYNGTAARESWKSLGYEKVEDLDRGYREFLRSLLK